MGKERALQEQKGKGKGLMEVAAEMHEGCVLNKGAGAGGRGHLTKCLVDSVQLAFYLTQTAAQGPPRQGHGPMQPISGCPGRALPRLGFL